MMITDQQFELKAFQFNAKMLKMVKNQVGDESFIIIFKLRIKIAILIILHFSNIQNYTTFYIAMLMKFK